MIDDWVLVGCGCTCVDPPDVVVRSALSNKFRYVLLPSILTKPCPPTAEVNITSPLPEFRDTLTLSPKLRIRQLYTFKSRRLYITEIDLYLV